MERTTISTPAVSRPLARRGCLQALGVVWLLVGVVAAVFYFANRVGWEAILSDAATIRIAVQAPLSGDQAPYGQAIVNGVTLAVETHANSLRGLGYKVEIVIYDDQALPQVAANNAARIVRNYNNLVVIGHLNSAATSAALPAYTAADLLVINPAASNPALTRTGANNLLRTIGRDDLQAAAGLGYAVQQLQTRRVYLVYEETPYGEEMAAAFRQEADLLRLQLVGEQMVPPATELNLTETISNTNPQLVYFAGLAEQAGPLFQQLREAGLEELYFMGPDSLDLPLMAELAPDIRGRFYYTRIVAPAAAYETAADFIAAYEERFGRPPDEYALQAYDAAQIALIALERAARMEEGKPARAQVLAAARSLGRTTGVLQRYDFTSAGNLTRASYLVYQFNETAEADWSDNNVAALIWFDDPGR